MAVYIPDDFPDLVSAIDIRLFENLALPKTNGLSSLSTFQ
jgi:hypothetical protein